MLNASSFNMRALTLGSVAAVGMVFAIVAGDLVANGNFMPLIAVGVAAVAAVVALSTGANYWVLIPLFSGATGSIAALPLPFNYQQLAIIGTFGLWIMHLIFKRAKVVSNNRWVDWLVYLNIAWLAVTYVKNPTGMAIFGDEMVGGRKYINIGMAFAAYVVLSQSVLPAKWAYKAPAILAIAMALPSLLTTLTEFYPPLGKIIWPLYSAVSITEFQRGATGAEGTLGMETRITGLAEVARPLILALCSYFPSVTLLSPLYPKRFGLFVLALVMAGLSGFRNMILAAAAYMAISTILRKRMTDLIPIAAFSFLLLALLIGGVQIGAPVPLTIQRSLAFLPLGWDERAVKTADGTSEWRKDMWRDAWDDPNIMKDKLFGDGFGFTAHEMKIMGDEILGIGGLQGGASYEMHMIRGSFHNGPLSSIRYAGAIGLGFITVLMLSTAAYAIRTVNNAGGTPYYVMAIFVGLPVIYQAFEFFVIFGAYDNAMITYFTTVGMLNMIDRSVRGYKQVIVSRDSNAGSIPALPDSLAGPNFTQPVAHRLLISR
jgi:hypothetical protein